MSHSLSPLILDFSALCALLHVEQNSFRRVWSELPHFYIGTGRDRRGARFDVSEVLQWLKAHRGENYGFEETQE